MYQTLGNKLLHIACLNGHLQGVEYLIEKGSNIEAEEQ